MGAPRLAPGTPMQTKGAGDDAEARTVTRSTPHRPVSRWHRAVWWLHHHLGRDDNGEFTDDPAGWSAQRSTVERRDKRSHRDRERSIERDNFAAARHAQDLREEDHTGGSRNAEERREFYGSKHARNAGVAETRVRGGGTAARERYEADQRAAWLYKPRGRSAQKG